MSTSTEGRQHLISELKSFIEEYRRKYPGSRPGVGNFVKWRPEQRKPDFIDQNGNDFQMTWPSVLIQAELQLLLRG